MKACLCVRALMSTRAHVRARKLIRLRKYPCFSSLRCINAAYSMRTLAYVSISIRVFYKYVRMYACICT